MKCEERGPVEMRMNALYSIEETAKILRVGSDYLTGMVERGEIPYVQVRNRVRFCGWQLKKWLNERQKGWKGNTNCESQNTQEELK